MTEKREIMGDIEVRPMRFDYDAVEDANPVWSRTCPEFSIYINALAVHSPYFERFLGVVSRKARERLENEQLVKEVTALIGQEAHHAYNFIRMNRFLAKRYPKVARFDADARAYFEAALTRYGFQRQVGFVAGYETFTFLAGMIVLDCYDELMRDADPVVRAMWVWHQVEEVEHGSVAIDVYRALYPEGEWLRKWMVIEAFSVIARETLKGYLHMCSVEGYWRSPRRAWRAIRFFVPMSLRLIRNALPALSGKYHPSTHPLRNDRRNPIAVGWRDFYASGGDTASLDDRKIAAMLSGSAAAESRPTAA